MKRLLGWIAFLGGLALTGPVTARATLRDQVGFTQNLGSTLPADLAWQTADGPPTTVTAALHGQPGVLVFGYYDCPELCGVTADAVISALRQIEPSVGRDFRFIHVSIDPSDTPEKSRWERTGAARRYGRGESTAGWRYLTGDQSRIATLTSAAGFRFQPAADGQGFAHPSGFLILTPDGTISRYFIGIDFAPAQIAAALRQAGAGQTGSPVANFLIACLHGGAPGQARWPWILMQCAVAGCALGLAGALFNLARNRGKNAEPPTSAHPSKSA